jgi:class 3 adenylate cyclase
MTASDDIGAWLERLGVGKYEEIFLTQEISLDVLPELTDADLRSLGVPLGPRRKILTAAASLRGKSAARIVTGSRGSAPSGSLERRNMTVMMCDLVDSTVLASRIDPEELRDILHAYLEAMTHAVRAFDGYIARYQGDGILAYFGYPQAKEDAAERAVRAGLRLLQAVRRVKGRADAQLQTRIGIATGLAVVGDLMAESASGVDAAVGEIPARAARLQTVAPPDSVVISGTTRDLLGEAFELEALGLHELKGFPRPEPVWRVVGEAQAESRFAARGGEHADLVGRDAEMARLVELWTSSRRGYGRAIVIQGEPGIGKSHLVQAFTQRLAEQAADAVFVQCSPYHINSALYPVTAWIERSAGFQADDAETERHAKLTAILSDAGVAEAELGELLALPAWEAKAYPPSEQEAVGRKEKTLSALARVLTSIRGDSGRLIIVEDAHWSDPTTLELLGRVIASAASRRLFIVVTCRPEFVAPWPAAAHLSLKLERLDRPDAETLMRFLNSARILPPELQARILDKADGVPLFVQELTKAVAEGVAAAQGDPAFRPAVAVPSTLHDTLMARLDRLAPTKVIAQTGAAIGREFSYRLLAACTGFKHKRLREGLAQLVEAELISCQGRPPDAVYNFSHALVRDAAYESMLRSRRTELHSRIATVLETRHAKLIAAEPELLAHHYAEAAQPELSIVWRTRAAERAMVRSAYTEVRNNLNQALELLAHLPATDEREALELDLRLKLATPLLATTGFTSAATDENYRRISELTESKAASEVALYVLWGLATTRLMRSELDAAEALSRRYMQHPVTAQNANAASAGHHLLAYNRWVRGDLAGARELFEFALASIDMQADHSVFRDLPVSILAHIACATSALLRQLGEADRAAELQELALREAIDTKRPASHVFVLYHSALGAMATGDVDRTKQLVSQLFGIMERHNVVYWRWHAEALMGWAEAKSGALEAGIGRIRYGLDLRRATLAALWVPVYLAGHAEVLLEHGRADESLSVLVECEQSMRDLQQHYVEPQLWRLRALALEATGASAEAIEASFDRALESADRNGALVYRLRAATDRAQRWANTPRSDQAYALLAPICAEFGDKLFAPDLPRARTILAMLRKLPATTSS